MAIFEREKCFFGLYIASDFFWEKIPAVADRRFTGAAHHILRRSRGKCARVFTHLYAKIGSTKICDVEFQSLVAELKLQNNNRPDKQIQS